MQIIENIALITINETVFVQALSFLIFLFIMKYVMFKPLRKTMLERESYIDNLKNEVSNAGETIDGLNKDIALKDSKLRQELADFKNDLNEQGKKEAVDILSSAQEDIKKVRDQACIEIEKKISTARIELQKEAKSLAVNIVEKVLDRRLA